MFGFYPKEGNLAGNYSDTDYKVSETVENYFTNFARTGNPNGEGLPNWPEFGAAGTFVKFTQSGTVEEAQDLRSPQCKVYREAIEAGMKPRK